MNTQQSSYRNGIESAYEILQHKKRGKSHVFYVSFDFTFTAMILEKEILVAYAEDRHEIRQRIIQDIEKPGNIKVSIVGDDGESLLEKMSGAEELPDICLIDISMPGMDGYQLLSEIKSRWPQIRCLILTIHQMGYHVQTMFRKGADGYLLKTAQPEEIILAIKTIYKTGSYHSELPDSTELKSLALTDREIELLKYVPTDLTYSEIAQAMNTTFKTIGGIRDRLSGKLNVRTRAGLIYAATVLGYHTIKH